MVFTELLVAGRWLLAIVLITAGAGKLSGKARESTRSALENYQVLPSAWHTPVVALLPWVEISLAGLLLTGVFVRVAAVCTAVLLGMFAVMVGWHVAHGRRFGCGCRRAGSISWNLAARDAALSVMAILIACGASPSLGVWPGPNTATSRTPGLLLVPVPLLTILTMTMIRVLKEAAIALRATSVSARAGEL